MAKDLKWEKITKEQVNAIMSMEDPNEFVKISNTLSLRYHSEFNDVEYTDNSRMSWDYYEDTEGSLWMHEVYAYQCGYEDYEVDGFSFTEDIFTTYNNPLTGLGEIWLGIDTNTGELLENYGFTSTKESMEKLMENDDLAAPIKFTNSLNKN